jgi:hypothetical protein
MQKPVVGHERAMNDPAPVGIEFERQLSVEEAENEGVVDIYSNAVG